MVGKSRADEGGDVSPSADLAQLTKKTKAKRRTEKETERQSKNPIAGNGQNAADDEIDDLFDKLKAYPKKKQKTNQGQGKEEAEVQNPSHKNKNPKILGNKDDIFGTNGNKGRKKTEEGYTIYTEEELGLNKKGGDTDLCPFDCDCCF